MPHQIVRAWLSLITPIALLLILLALLLYSARKLGSANAWRAMRPLFIFGFICLVVQLSIFGVRCAPYYLHGTVWSGATLRKIGLFGAGSMVIMVVYILASAKKIMLQAKQMESDRAQ